MTPNNKYIFVERYRSPKKKAYKRNLLIKSMKH